MPPLLPTSDAHWHNPALLALYFVAGGLGSLIACCLRDGKIELPRILHQKNGTFIDPGFLATTAFGALLAAIVDGRPATAFFVGMSVSYIGREGLRPFLAGVLKPVGLTFLQGDTEVKPRRRIRISEKPALQAAVHNSTLPPA